MTAYQVYIYCLFKNKETKRCKLIQYLPRTRFSLLIWWFSCLLCVTRCLFRFLIIKFISPTPSPHLVKRWVLSLGLREMFRELLLILISYCFWVLLFSFWLHGYSLLMFHADPHVELKTTPTNLCANNRLLHWGSGEVMVSVINSYIK